MKCIAKKTPRVLKAGKMQSIVAKQPFDIVGVDILGPLPMTPRKYRYILVFTDYFTKFPICFRLKDITALTVAKKFLKVMLEYGLMNQVVSDRGSQFMSQVFKALANAAGVKHTPSTSYHPQTNGLTERFNHTLCVMLSMYVHDNQSDWDLYLPFVQYAYRDTPHTSTGYSPFELLRTYRPNSLIDFKFPDVSLELLNSNPRGVESLKERIKTMHADVLKRLQAARERQAEYYDQGRRDVSFKLGDRVWFYWPARGVAAHKLKLSIPWSGPYWVKEKLGPVNYKLMKPDGSILKQTVHVDRLKPCTSTLGTPQEFVSLHENDSFDPAVERGEAEYKELPVIREVKIETSNVIPTADPNFIEIPMETEKEIKDTDLIKQIVNDSNSVQDLNDLESHLKLKGEEENTKKFRPVLKDIRRRKFELKGMIEDDNNDVILPETEEKPPQFYTKDTPANSPDEIPNSEFIEAFDEPEYKKELYNALVDIYTQYRDRDPSMNVSPVKKRIKNYLYVSK